MALLSIVVPVFNVARYLRETIDSVLNQEVKDIEVICIDDASTDESYGILQGYAEKDKRIIVLQHKVNAGPSISRNEGLKYATGTYISFFDSDDTVCPDMYSKMLSVMSNVQIDVIMCGFCQMPSGTTSMPCFISNEPHSPYELIRGQRKLHADNEFCFSWRFMFRRDFLYDNNLLFNETINVGEDTLFNMECFMKANRVYVIPQALYNYRTNNQGSLMKACYKPHLDEILQLQIQEKKRIIQQYDMDKYAPITKDMSADVIRRYIPMILDNFRNAPDKPDMTVCIKNVLSMPMVRDAMSVVGFRNIYPSWKEYLFHLALKFRIMPVVARMWK